MTKQAINPSAVFRSLEHGFSQAVVASGTRTLYVSGQTAWEALADPGFLIEVEATAVLD